MARISTYAIDGTPVSSDKLIGTDSAGAVTKNYPLGDVADWLKSSGATGILGQNNYTFQIALDPNEGRKIGSFSFENYGGDGTAFSDVTTLRFSASSSTGQNVAAYIDTTVGGRVILGQLNDLNSFGVYVLTSFVQNQTEPAFFDATLVFVKGNGVLRGSSSYGFATYSDVSSSGGINSLKVGLSNEEGLTDVLKSVYDGADRETKLRLSTNKFEVSGTSITRASTNPVMRLVADNADNPSTGETMGTLRFTRNFEDPLALDLARAIFADFSERVTSDGGTIEGSEECVASELELIVSGEYLINMVDIKPEYTGTLGSTKADLVFYINNGSGTPTEKLRITKDGDVEVKDPNAGIILRSENNTPYRIVVGNTGALAAIPPNSFKPSITTLPTISGTLDVGKTLTATAGNVSGVPTPTQVLQWQRSDDGTTGWANIAGATGTTYLLGSLDQDKYIRVEQTEENILGTATANSVSTTQIQPAAVDLDYIAVLNTASTLGYTAPSAAQQTLQNTLVEDLKTAGVWDKLDLFYVFATDGDSDFATLNWKAPTSFQSTKVNSPTFTYNSGFTGDGSSSYLDLNYNPAINKINLDLNNNSIGVYQSNPSAPTGVMISSFGSTFLELDNDNGTSRIISFNMTALGDVPSVGTDAQAGLWISTRDNSSNYTIYKNSNVLITPQRSSSAIPNANIRVLSRTNNSLYGAGTISMGFVGASLNATEVSDLNTSWNNYLTAL